jgi:hypothetical protein
MGKPGELEVVALVLNAEGFVTSVWASQGEAEAHAAKYNADPFVDGEPDTDAPYRVQVWCVT